MTGNDISGKLLAELQSIKFRTGGMMSFFRTDPSYPGKVTTSHTELSNSKDEAAKEAAEKKLNALRTNPANLAAAEIYTIEQLLLVIAIALDIDNYDDRELLFKIINAHRKELNTTHVGFLDECALTVINRKDKENKALILEFNIQTEVKKDIGYKNERLFRLSSAFSKLEKIFTTPQYFAEFMHACPKAVKNLKNDTAYQLALHNADLAQIISDNPVLSKKVSKCVDKTEDGRKGWFSISTKHFTHLRFAENVFDKKHREEKLESFGGDIGILLKEIKDAEADIDSLENEQIIRLSLLAEAFVLVGNVKEGLQEGLTSEDATKNLGDKVAKTKAYFDSLYGQGHEILKDVSWDDEKGVNEFKQRLSNKHAEAIKKRNDALPQLQALQCKLPLLKSVSASDRAKAMAVYLVPRVAQYRVVLSEENARKNWNTLFSLPKGRYAQNFGGQNNEGTLLPEQKELIIAGFALANDPITFFDTFEYFTKYNTNALVLSNVIAEAYQDESAASETQKTAYKNIRENLAKIFTNNSYKVLQGFLTSQAITAEVLVANLPALLENKELTEKQKRELLNTRDTEKQSVAQKLNVYLTNAITHTTYCDLPIVLRRSLFELLSQPYYYDKIKLSHENKFTWLSVVLSSKNLSQIEKQEIFNLLIKDVAFLNWCVKSNATSNYANLEFKAAIEFYKLAQANRSGAFINIFSAGLLASDGKQQAVEILLGFNKNKKIDDGELKNAMLKHVLTNASMQRIFQNKKIKAKLEELSGTNAFAAYALREKSDESFADWLLRNSNNNLHAGFFDAPEVRNHLFSTATTAQMRVMLISTANNPFNLLIDDDGFISELNKRIENTFALGDLMQLIEWCQAIAGSDFDEQAKGELANKILAGFNEHLSNNRYNSKIIFEALHDLAQLNTNLFINIQGNLEDQLKDLSAELFISLYSSLDTSGVTNYFFDKIKNKLATIEDIAQVIKLLIENELNPQLNAALTERLKQILKDEFLLKAFVIASDEKGKEKYREILLADKELLLKALKLSSHENYNEALKQALKEAQTTLFKKANALTQDELVELWDNRALRNEIRAILRTKYLENNHEAYIAFANAALGEDSLAKNRLAIILADENIANKVASLDLANDEIYRAIARNTALLQSLSSNAKLALLRKNVLPAETDNAVLRGIFYSHDTSADDITKQKALFRKLFEDEALTYFMPELFTENHTLKLFTEEEKFFITDASPKLLGFIAGKLIAVSSQKYSEKLVAIYRENPEFSLPALKQLSERKEFTEQLKLQMLAMAEAGNVFTEANHESLKSTSQVEWMRFLSMIHDQSDARFRKEFFTNRQYLVQDIKVSSCGSNKDAATLTKFAEAGDQQAKIDLAQFALSPTKPSLGTPQRRAIMSLFGGGDEIESSFNNSDGTDTTKSSNSAHASVKDGEYDEEGFSNRRPGLGMYPGEE